MLRAEQLRAYAESTSMSLEQWIRYRLDLGATVGSVDEERFRQAVAETIARSDLSRIAPMQLKAATWDDLLRVDMTIHVH